MKTVYKYGCGVVTIFKDGQYYVMDEKEEHYIVPPGKYDYIDGFYKGVARVKLDGKMNFVDPSKTTEDRWGLIDTEGQEVLPLEYSEIWKFYNTKLIRAKIINKEIAKEAIEAMFYYVFSPKVPSQIPPITYRVVEYSFNFTTHILTNETKRREKEEEYERIKNIEQNYSWRDAFEDSEEAASATDFEW